MVSANEFLRQKEVSDCVGDMKDWIVDTSEDQVADTMEQYAKLYHEDKLQQEAVVPENLEWSYFYNESGYTICDSKTQNDYIGYTSSESRAKKIVDSHNKCFSHTGWIDGKNPPLMGYYYIMVMDSGIKKTIDYHKGNGEWQNHEKIIKYANIPASPL